MVPYRRHGVISSPVGPLTLVAHDDALAGLTFVDHRHPLADTVLGAPVDVDVDGFLVEVAGQLDAYFRGARRSFSLPVVTRGTLFQERVWGLLRTIDHGTTRTYGSLATELGDPGLARAVGAAVGRNPVSIVVPCHRVLGASGRLTGFAGGLDRKQALLDLEARVRGGTTTLFDDVDVEVRIDRVG